MTMTERRIDLNIGLTPNMPDLNQSGSGTPRREASDADRRAFEQSLEQQDSLPAGKAADTEPVPKPFNLFPGAFVPSSTPVPQAPDGLAQALNEAADRMLVGDGGSGRREVRLDLKAEVLPGVTVSIYEEQGCLVAEFVCSRESSREILNRCAQALANELAQSLSRDTLVRVGTDDPEDRCLLEAASAA